MSVLNISEAASLALHTVCVLANRPVATQTTHDIAERLGVSKTHLAKVIQRMVKAGIIDATRGPKGGSRLARSPKEISLLEVYEAIDGPIGKSACLLGKPACDGNCVLGPLLQNVNNQVRQHLMNQKVAGLAGIFHCNGKGEI